MLSNKTKRELKINQRRILIDSIEMGLASPNQIKVWGERRLPNGKTVGQIKNSKTVNYKRFTPLRDGLFCERIFGPIHSFVCACGRRQPRIDTRFCEKCEVEYTDQRTRRYRLGYISLVSPATHVWYLKGRPSYLPLFLGKRKKRVVALTYCNAYLVEQSLSSRDALPHISERQDHGIREFSDRIKGEKQTERFLEQFSLLSREVSLQSRHLYEERNEDEKRYRSLDREVGGDTNSHITKTLSKNKVFPSSYRYRPEERDKQEESKHVKSPYPHSIQAIQANQTGQRRRDGSIATSFLRFLAEIIDKRRSIRRREIGQEGYPIKNSLQLLTNPNIVLKVFQPDTLTNVPDREESMNFDLYKRLSSKQEKMTNPFPFSLYQKNEKSEKGESGNEKSLISQVNNANKKPDTPFHQEKEKDISSLAQERNENKIKNSQKQEKFSAPKRKVFSTRESFSPSLPSINRALSAQNQQEIISLYDRAQSLPFLPTLICKYNLRDELLNLLASPPALNDTPLPSYCQKPRWQALRDVHKFMAEQAFLSEQSSKETDAMHVPLGASSASLALRSTPSSPVSVPINRFLSQFVFERERNTLFLSSLKKWKVRKGSIPLNRLHTHPKDKFIRLYAKRLLFSVYKIKDTDVPIDAPPVTNSQKKLLKVKNSSSPLSHGKQVKSSTILNGNKLGNNNNINTRDTVLASLCDTRITDVMHYLRAHVVVQDKGAQGSMIHSILNRMNRPLPSITKRWSSFSLFAKESKKEKDQEILFSPFLIFPQTYPFQVVQEKRLIKKRKTDKQLPDRDARSVDIGSGANATETISGESRLKSNSHQDDIPPYDVDAQAMHYENDKVQANTNKPSNQSPPSSIPAISLPATIPTMSFSGARDQSSHTTLLDEIRSYQRQFVINKKWSEKRLSDKISDSSTEIERGGRTTSSHELQEMAETFSYIPIETSTSKQRDLSDGDDSRERSKRSNLGKPRMGVNGVPSHERSFVNTGVQHAAMHPPSPAMPAINQVDQIIPRRDGYDAANLSESKRTREKRKNGEFVSPLELRTIQEILSYTGGGALERLLQRFDTSLLSIFLRAEIQTAHYFYKARLSRLNERKNRNWKRLTRNEKKILTRLSRRISQNARRLKLSQLLTRSQRRPEWMMISRLPVLPPDLRPILQMSESLAVASDLNNLYQRVIYRNNRYQKLRFIDFHLVTAIQRLVQDAVDRLIDNGKGGSKPFSTPSGRPLKSLSDTLKGKKGRFRLNLLGKRVDFSGRSVIVVSPHLKIHECGLPRGIALELYHYFLLRSFMIKREASSIVVAKQIIKQQKAGVWERLQEIIYHHPVLLNRAPTLHRLGIQAFQPKLVLGNAILLHPLVCTAFNADFDGDQMGVHLPLCLQARAEAWDLLWARNNLLSPATGQPALLPTQDMVLGFYYITQMVTGHTSHRFNRFFSDKTSSSPDIASGGSRGKRKSQGKVLHAAPFAPNARSQGDSPPLMAGDSQNRFRPVLSHTSGKLKRSRSQASQFSKVFFTQNDLIHALQTDSLDLHTPVYLQWDCLVENDEQSNLSLELRINSWGGSVQIYPHYKRRKEAKSCFSKLSIRTTAGRVLVNTIIFSKQASLAL